MHSNDVLGARTRSADFLDGFREGLASNKGEEPLKKARFVGGLLLIVAAALVFIFKATSVPLPVAITLLIVGIALVATARRMR